jgi:hypothetical protein
MICWQKFNFLLPTSSHLCLLNVESSTEYFYHIHSPSNRLSGWKFPLFILSIVLISIIAWWNVGDPYTTVKLSKSLIVPLVWTSLKKCDRSRCDLVWSISPVFCGTEFSWAVDYGQESLCYRTWWFMTFIPYCISSIWGGEIHIYYWSFVCVAFPVWCSCLEH